MKSSYRRIIIIFMVFISESTVLECLAKDELTVLSYSHSILKQFNELPVSLLGNPSMTAPESIIFTMHHKLWSITYANTLRS